MHLANIDGMRIMLFLFHPVRRWACNSHFTMKWGELNAQAVEYCSAEGKIWAF